MKAQSYQEATLASSEAIRAPDLFLNHERKSPNDSLVKTKKSEMVQSLFIPTFIEEEKELEEEQDESNDWHESGFKQTQSDARGSFGVPLDKEEDERMKIAEVASLFEKLQKKKKEKIRKPVQKGKESKSFLVSESSKSPKKQEEAKEQMRPKIKNKETKPASKDEEKNPKKQLLGEKEESKKTIHEENQKGEVKEKEKQASPTPREQEEVNERKSHRVKSKERESAKRKESGSRDEKKSGRSEKTPSPKKKREKEELAPVEENIGFDDLITTRPSNSKSKDDRMSSTLKLQEERPSSPSLNKTKSREDRMISPSRSKEESQWSSKPQKANRVSSPSPSRNQSKDKKERSGSPSQKGHFEGESLGKSNSGIPSRDVPLKRVDESPEVPEQSIPSAPSELSGKPKRRVKIMGLSKKGKAKGKTVVESSGGNFVESSDEEEIKGKAMQGPAVLKK